MPVAIPDVKKTWTNRINVVTLGATREEGGTRTTKVTVGGATSLPFHQFEGAMPHAPAIAMEICDVVPEDWPELLKVPFAEVLSDPGLWAKKCVEQYGADLIC